MMHIYTDGRVYRRVTALRRNTLLEQSSEGQCRGKNVRVFSLRERGVLLHHAEETTRHFSPYGTSLGKKWGVFVVGRVNSWIHVR